MSPHRLFLPDAPPTPRRPAGPPVLTLDANEAVARVAYALSELIAIYPITPSSPMAEWTDQWMSERRHNLWGSTPDVIEMQSEGGVAGALHGALARGCLATTFTASQGLLLMLPNMFKIAGELTPFVLHVAARTVAAHALSIFGDHGDVMATRMTGFAMLASGSVQEAQDMALVSHAATLRSRVPFLHFFDGFRTSHQISKINGLLHEDMEALIDGEAIREHRGRALDPDKPHIRGTAQNPDVYFQAREACNPWYLAGPAIVQETMDALAARTGRAYHLFDYGGAPDAERVVVLMGSGAEVAHEAVEHLVAAGEKVGVLKVRLFRPFCVESFINALPHTVKSIAVLDRTKEPGAAGEPLYQDVLTAITEMAQAGSLPFEATPRVVGGRYGLSSKEFTPAMAKAVLDNLAACPPRNHFTVGIHDDVTHTSLSVPGDFHTASKGVTRALFFGLGSDGAVGASKNAIKIIGEMTDLDVQGYFVYDSKKAGALTVSHLRFGKGPIRSAYLVHRASFVACYQPQFLERIDMLSQAEPGGTFLLNTPHPPAEVWDTLPRPVQDQIIAKQLRLLVVDAYGVAQGLGLGRRINTVMQTAFFLETGILEPRTAILAIKQHIASTYGKRGNAVVERNCEAVDLTADALYEVPVPAHATATQGLRPPVGDDAPAFVRDVLGPILAGHGDDLPTSAMPPDGCFPTGTAKHEKRAIAPQIPIWDPATCIQCGKCVMVCPHAAIRGKLLPPEAFEGRPESVTPAASRWPERKQDLYLLQVAPDDCTGCNLCIEACPAKNKSNAGLKAINMADLADVHEREAANWDYFLSLPQPSRESLDMSRTKDIQLLEPLFEFSGACAGCGETPYVRLLTQLFGDRMVVANATGCSSIYGGNLPTTPWTVDASGRGPAWANSLFEDNAEFGLGIRAALDKQGAIAAELLGELEDSVGTQLVDALLMGDQSTEAGIRAQRERIVHLRQRLAENPSPRAKDLASLASALVRRSTWILGGDGWAYDIGYGGLDHVIASGRDVNILVLDTEVYSNTGGQQSKATPRGAVAKFAANGKAASKKDLAMLAMTYGTVYVARIAMGANENQAIKAIAEAEAFEGPSLVIAYAHCAAHGCDLCPGRSQQKAAVESGHWPLFRFDPRRIAQGLPPLQLDSKAPRLPLKEYVYNETRYRMLAMAQPEVASRLLDEAQEEVRQRWRLYEHWASAPWSPPAAAPADASASPQA